MSDDFLQTEFGGLLAKSKQFLWAADVLRRSEDYTRRPTLMFVPVLHLTAHGIELFLKANLVHAGVSLKDLKDGFGHDITRLWEDERNGLLRSSARQSATDAWNDARRSGKWPDSFEGDAFEVFVNNLKALADLHSQGTEKGYPFQLRYLAPVGAEGPRPNQLLDVFLPLCDQCLRLASGI